MSSNKTPSSFSENLVKIEAHANRIESSDAPLEHALADFEEDIKLIRQAHEALEKAEQKMTLWN